MAFKMKGFSPFTKREDGYRPMVTAHAQVADIEAKQERIDKKADKGKDVSGKQDRLDRRSERLVAREEKRAARKERKADKKLEKGKGKQAARKKYKAGKIREAVSPLAKKSAYKKDKKVPKIPTKSPHDIVQKLQAKKAAGTITAAELKRLRELQNMMETGSGSYGHEQQPNRAGSPMKRLTGQAAVDDKTRRVEAYRGKKFKNS
tara:strand:+ start:4315 stop:4929 length:615 start_codon:yes stop_codon:yes gene_type:complete